MRRFTHRDMHDQLMDQFLTEEYETAGEVPAQALLCPYYVPLSGRLGADSG